MHWSEIILMGVIHDFIIVQVDYVRINTFKPEFESQYYTP